MRETIGIRVLAVIAAMVALSLGSQFFVPLAFGLLLSVVLHPIVGALRRVRIPDVLGATIAVLFALVILVLAIGLLEPPVRAAVGELPQTLTTARTRLQSLGIPLPGGKDSASTRAKPASTSTAASDTSANAAGSKGGGQSVPSGIGPAIARAFGITASALFAFVEVLLLAFFVLAAGDAWRDKVRFASRSPESAQQTLNTTHEIRRVVLRYLLVNVIINAAQGILVGAIVWMLGFPSPVLWGVLTFIAEFIPYFGGAAMVGFLLLTGIAAGNGIGHALLAPAAYLLITTLQNNLVSPAAYGRSLRLNPTAILAGVMFWGVVWGIAGVFLAVPLLATIRIIAEKNDALSPLAVFLAD
ncbi:MAG: AI-2E family transporter [Gemmatimonadaceae bacterium]